MQINDDHILGMLEVASLLRYGKCPYIKLQSALGEII
jgi:hypothetical protein